MHDHLSRMVHQHGLRIEDADLIDAFLKHDAKQWGRKKRLHFKKARAKSTTPKKSGVTLEVRARYLSLFSRLLPVPLKEATTGDIENALEKYAEDHSQNTVHMMVLYLLFFLKWLKSPRINTDTIAEMLPPSDPVTKQAADVLTPAEVEKLIHAPENSRDRALIAVLYEGGLRPVEVTGLLWEEVVFDHRGVVLTTAGKTGKPRRIRMTTWVPLLAQWKHDSGDESGPVFKVTRGGNKGGPVTTRTIQDIVRNAAIRAGILDTSKAKPEQRRIYPYLLRHSRVTHLMEDRVPESVIKMQHWGALSTGMLARYAHLSDRFADDALWAASGMPDQPEQDQAGRKKTPQPVQCPGCSFVNLPGSRLCALCARPLTEEGIADAAAAIDAARKTEEYQAQRQAIEAMQKEILELKRAMKRRD